MFAEHESRYTRPLEEVVSKVAQAWKRNGHFKLFAASQHPEMFGAQNVFATLRRDVFEHCKDRGQTHIFLEGNSAEMLPRLGAESNLQLDEFPFCNFISFRFFFKKELSEFSELSEFTLRLLRFQHIEFDLIFIDGNHAYEASPYPGTSVTSVCVLQDLCNLCFCFNHESELL